jgi:ribosomal protein S18 acetylase RimI-like enzyme
MIFRPAEPADALHVARVHVRSWQAAYRGLLSDDYLDGLSAEDRARRYTFDATGPLDPATIVALDDERLCGFATTVPARDADVAGQGELAALYVDPDWWGRKIGVRLVAMARESLLKRGFEAAVLWVMVGNDRAQRFYRKDGWCPDGARRTVEVWGARVDEVRFRRRLG